MKDNIYGFPEVGCTHVSLRPNILAHALKPGQLGSSIGGAGTNVVDGLLANAGLELEQNQVRDSHGWGVLLLLARTM